jgi:hypothetical protein
MTATYTLGGMGSSSMIPNFEALFPDRDNGPNQQLRIDFPNGVSLSIVYGWGAYATADTVEVAVFPLASGEWLTRDIRRSIDGTEIGDDVDGFCDADLVHAYFLAVQGWTP